MEKNNGKKGTETLTENEKKGIEELAIEFYGDYARPITVEDKRCIKFIEFQIEAIEKYIIPYIKEIILNSRKDNGKSYLQQYGDDILYFKEYLDSLKKDLSEMKEAKSDATFTIKYNNAMDNIDEVFTMLSEIVSNVADNFDFGYRS